MSPSIIPTYKVRGWTVGVGGIAGKWEGGKMVAQKTPHWRGSTPCRHEWTRELLSITYTSTMCLLQSEMLISRKRNYLRPPTQYHVTLTAIQPALDYLPWTSE